jgi:GDP-mannose pyrophosphatase NudK
MKAEIIQKNILSNKWGEYAEYIINYTRSDGRVEIQKREIQDNGNGAAVLLYNLELQEIILIKQFRLASQVNGNPSGVIIEACAGLVENDDPHTTIKKEIKEEIGIVIDKVDMHYKGYATPGAKTELIYFFTAAYPSDILLDNSGGLLSEQEDIVIVRYNFHQAYDMIATGEIIDLKTISLLQYAKINLFTE